MSRTDSPSWGGDDPEGWLTYILGIQFSFDPEAARTIAHRLFQPFKLDQAARRQVSG